MDSVFPIVLSLLGTVVTTYLLPWLSKKNKLAFAEFVATVAVDALALVRQNNPNLSAVEYAQQVALMLKTKFGGKLSVAAADRIAASAVAKAGIR